MQCCAQSHCVVVPGRFAVLRVAHSAQALFPRFAFPWQCLGIAALHRVAVVGCEGREGSACGFKGNTFVSWFLATPSSLCRAGLCLLDLVFGGRVPRELWLGEGLCHFDRTASGAALE